MDVDELNPFEEADQAIARIQEHERRNMYGEPIRARQGGTPWGRGSKRLPPTPLAVGRADHASREPRTSSIEPKPAARRGRLRKPRQEALQPDPAVAEAVPPADVPAAAAAAPAEPLHTFVVRSGDCFSQVPAASHEAVMKVSVRDWLEIGQADHVPVELGMLIRAHRVGGRPIDVRYWLTDAILASLKSEKEVP